MKRNIIIISISSLLLIGIIVTIIVISNRKYELKIDSFDYKTSLSFGEIANKEGSIVEEYASVTYEVEDANDIYENVIKKSEYFKFEVEDENSEFSVLNKDGYYYKAYISDGKIALANFIDHCSTFHISSPGRLTIGNPNDLENCYYRYFEANWEIYNKYNKNNIFNVVDKNTMISFYNSVSNEIAYYDEVEDKIFLRNYLFFGSPEVDGERCSENYPFWIEFTDNGYQLWYTIYSEEDIKNDILDFNK